MSNERRKLIDDFVCVDGLKDAVLKLLNSPKDLTSIQHVILKKFKENFNDEERSFIAEKLKLEKEIVVKEISAYKVFKI